MGIKIHQYPNEATIVNGQDFYDIDAYVSLGVYETKKIKAMTLVDGLSALKPYGSFYDTTTQTVASGASAAMKLNTTAFNQHIEVVNDGLGNPTVMQVGKTGVYDLKFSAQLNRTTGGSSKQVIIWLRVNGSDVPYTSGHMTLEANHGKDIAAWNYFLELNADDTIQLMWSQNDSIEILHELGTAFPSVPSVIATINMI